MAIIWLRNSLTSTKKMTFTGILHSPNAAHIQLPFHMDIFYKSISICDMSGWIKIQNQTNSYLKKIIWVLRKLHDNVCRAWNWNNKTPIFWKFLGILKPWWWFNEFIMSYKALYRFIVLLENQMESITLPDTKGLESQRRE